MLSRLWPPLEQPALLGSRRRHRHRV